MFRDLPEDILKEILEVSTVKKVVEKKKKMI